MSYSRATAKTRALARVDSQHGLRLPSLGAWQIQPVPFTPRCRRCGTKILSGPSARPNRCTGCGGVL